MEDSKIIRKFEEKRNSYIKNLLNEKLAIGQLTSLSFSQNPLMKEFLKNSDFEERLDESIKMNEKMNKIKKNKRTVTLKALKTTKAGSLTDNDASLNHLNEEFQAPIIKSSITNEISFTKELQYLLRNRVINHDMILDTELKMVKDQYDDILEKKTRANTDEIVDESVDKYKILSRFRKAVRKVFIVQKMHQMHIRSMKKLQEENKKIKTFAENDSNPAMFDRNYYSRPREPKFPDEAKRMLQLEPVDRTDDMIRFITISLNFCVPEFFSFPVNIQKRIAKYSFYQEFDSPRVVVREGDVGHAYYMVISGVGSVKKSNKSDIDSVNFVISKPTHFVKSGDTFGEIALIYNIKRQATVSAYGDRPFGLLVIEKEDFFKIQSPISNEEKKRKFLETKVPVFKSIDYPIERLNDQEGSNIFSIYFRHGAKICDDSSKERWLFVIKSGSCRVLKKIRFDKNALSYFYAEAESRRKIISNKLTSLEGIEKPARYIKEGKRFIKLPNNYLESIDYNDDAEKKTYTYLEMRKLDEGDVFGLHDLIFTEENEINPLILVSDGAECILISRIKFMENATAESLLKMKFKLPPYPNDETFIMRYFSFLQWERFRRRFQEETLDNIEKKDKIKPLNGFN